MRNFNSGFFIRTLLSVIVWLTFILTLIPSQVRAGKSASNEVWIVYFGSADCPVCENVKPLLDGLVGEYDLRVRSYDITRPDDYLIFSQIESVHSEKKFSVPMVIAGDNILIGEKQIRNNLRKLVDRYRRTTGARLPYLGEAESRTSGDRTQDADCAQCRDKGRPPSIQSELKKLKVILDKLIE